VPDLQRSAGSLLSRLARPGEKGPQVGGRGSAAFSINRRNHLPKPSVILRRQKVYIPRIADGAMERTKGPTPKSEAFLGERP
jgi:hypothetical protein